MEKIDEVSQLDANEEESGQMNKAEKEEEKKQRNNYPRIREGNLYQISKTRIRSGHCTSVQNRAMRNMFRVIIEGGAVIVGRRKQEREREQERENEKENRGVREKERE